MEINWNAGIIENDAFKILPEGLYQMMITTSEVRVFDDGNETVVQIFTVVSGEQKNNTYKKTYSFNGEYGAKSIQHWINTSLACGVKVSPRTPEQLLNKMLFLKIGIFKNDQGKEFNFIKSWCKEENAKNLSSSKVIAKETSVDEIPF